MTKTKQTMPMPVRLPADLKQWVRQQAEVNLRSVNAEIIAILSAERQRQSAPVRATAEAY